MPKHRYVLLVALSTDTKEPSLFGDDHCWAMCLCGYLGRPWKIRHLKAMAGHSKNDVYCRCESDTALPHPYFKAKLGLFLHWVIVTSLTVKWRDLKRSRIRFSQKKTWCNACKDLSDEVQGHHALGWIPVEGMDCPHLENTTKHSTLAALTSSKPLLSVLNRKSFSF